MMLGASTGHDNTALSHSLLISVDTSVKNTDLFLKVIRRLKNRFGLQIALCVKEPEYLFFNQGLLQNIETGLFSRVWVSDQPSRHGFDFFEFAKRQETDRVTLARQADLSVHWMELVKLLVNTLYSETGSAYSDDFHFGTFKQQGVREIDSQNPDTLLSFLKHPFGAVQNIYDRRASLFVTKQGLERFGGYETFRELSLTIGGIKPREFRRIWIIDNNHTLQQFRNNIGHYIEDKRKPIILPGFLNSNHSSVIIDINPAHVKPAEFDTSALEIPRACLNITQTDQFSMATSKTAKAMFAMSNYNKAKYIPSALYSVVMQTYETVALNIIDDISSDESRDVIGEFLSLLNPEKITVEFKENTDTRGTYWIRNEIIHSNNDQDVVYFVNDSDDYSVAQRAGVQLKEISRHNDAKIVFGDIVRVDSNYQLLPLDGKVERYGTASVASCTKIHDEFGYYENIMKNADTEFIERLRHFAGREATKWFRYPILFQPFDGTNLTSDIYSVQESGVIRQSLDNRERHVNLFKERHNALTIDKLPEVYGFHAVEFPAAYRQRLREYLIPNL